MTGTSKLIFIFGFLIVISAIIFWTGRKNKTSKEFFLAGGKLPWYVVAGTILATFTGGGTIVGYVGSYYANGLIWIWVGLGTIIAAIIVGGIADKIHGLGRYTVGDILESRFGKGTRTVGGIIMIIAEFAVVCAMTAAFAGSIAAATGIDPNICRLIGIVLFVFTAIVGGLRGVAITDAIQAVLILVGVCIAGVLAINNIGGVSAFFSQVDPVKLSPFNNTIPFKVMLGNVVSIIGLNLVNQAAFFQRIGACKTPADAKKSVLGYMVSQILLFVIMIPLLGLAASVLLPGDVAKDSVIVKLLETVSSPAFSLFYTGLIVAATLTTANSLLLSCGMSFVQNVLDVITHKEMDENKKAVVGKWFVVICGAVAYLVATLVPSVITLLMMAYTIMCIIVVPMYMGIFTKTGGSASGFYSLLIGGAVTFALELLKRPFGVHPALISLPITFIVYIALKNFKGGATKEQLEIVDKMKK